MRAWALVARGHVCGALSLVYDALIAECGVLLHVSRIFY